MPAFTDLNLKQKRNFLKDTFEDDDGLHARISKMNTAQLLEFHDSFMVEEPEEDEQATSAEQEEEEFKPGPNPRTDLGYGRAFRGN